MVVVYRAVLPALVALATGNEGGGKDNDMNKFDDSLFLFLLFSIFTVWLLVHSVLTGFALVPAVRELLRKRKRAAAVRSAAARFRVRTRCAR